MALVFDAECVGEDPEKLDAEVREYLVKGKKGEEALNELALSPFTGEVVSIACWDTEYEAGVVFLAKPLPKTDFPAVDRITFVGCANEKEVLQRFWKVSREQEDWVSFNGRTFDVPYMAARSAVHGLEVDTRLVRSNRYSGTHYDLRDIIECQGAYRGHFNFWLLCRLLGVQNPKGRMSGADVPKAWTEGRFLDVALYNLDDTLSLRDCAEKMKTTYALSF